MPSDPPDIAVAARGAEPRRLAIMSAIWNQANVPQAWIASRLGVRSAAHVSQLLSRDAAKLADIFGAKRWKAWRNVSGIVDPIGRRGLAFSREAERGMLCGMHPGRTTES